jgi:hypothetical protein
MATTTTTSPPTHHKVYLTESVGGGARNHIALFLTPGPSPSLPAARPSTLPPDLPSGTIYNVTGTILLGAGQVYEVRPSVNPQYTPEHIPGTYRCIGRIRAQDLERFERVCEGVEVPGPQVDLRGRVLVPGKKVRRCTEWVEEVVGLLKGDGVLIEEGEEEGKGKE